MNWPVECAAVIPCLNEEATIASVVSAVGDHLPTIFVVDDGSSDATAVRAETAGAKVLAHAETLGKGAALQTGWKHARASGFTWALALDGDGQHSADDLPGFFRCAEHTGAQLIVGNRMHSAGQMPWVRRLTNAWMSRQLSRAAGRPMPDSQNGFRLMNLGAWAGLALSTTHFQIESELLLAFATAGLRIEFVSVRTIYRKEKSKIHPLRDTVRWFTWWRQVRHSLGGATRRPTPQAQSH